MMTKSNVVALVNAMPETSFERCSGFEIQQEPSRAEKIMALTLSGALVVVLLVPMLMVAADGVRGMAKKGDGWIASWKARKAAKAAAVHKTLDDKSATEQAS